MREKISQEGLAHFLLIITGLVIFTFASASVIPTTQEFPSKNNESVLGENEESGRNEDKSEVKEGANTAQQEIKKEESKGSEGERKIEERKKEEIKKPEELKKEEGQQNPELQKNNRFKSSLKLVKEKKQSDLERGKSETEIETADGQKIKTKIEDDGRVKLEVENKKLKIKFENGKFRVEQEDEASESGELDEDNVKELEQEIEQEFEDKGIEIASSSGGLTIKKNKIKARTQFPLSINPKTNELVVTTPAGQKTVTVLPDQAVENMLAGKVLSEVNQEKDQDSIEIEQRNDELVYKVQGEKDHKFLGFIPLKTAITAFVSAQTGELTAQEQSLLSRIISQLSF